MKIVFMTLLMLATMTFGETANAGCTCECVNGRMQPLCENSLDMPPICPPTICPIMAPSLPRFQRPWYHRSVHQECQPAQSCDTFENCRWETVCR